MAEPTRIKLGIIGCGGIASYHLGHLIWIPEAKVMALTDTNKANIENLQGRFSQLSNCQVFSDYKDMMASVELDAVEILTPHTLHFQQAMDALDRGLHAIIEKPMVCTTNHAKRLIAKAQKNKRVVLVSYQRHYQPQFLHIKKVIESGELGDLQFISAMQCQDWMEPTRGTWRQDPALSGGGQLNDSASHLLDIILWTTSLEPAEVLAFSDNLGTPVDINSSLSIRFSHGAQANIAVVGHSPCWWEDINIWGSKGVIFYRNGKLEYLPRGGEAILEPVKLPPSSDPDRNFINAILGRENNECPATCGLQVIKLTEAIWESAKTGKMAKIPP
jgi:predicted dehydrogenase